MIAETRHLSDQSAGKPTRQSDIEKARERIAALLSHTRIFTSPLLNEKSGAQLFFKREDEHPPGSFKARGAVNAVFSLSDIDAKQGVLTHSSGNHGAALAFAAEQRGIRSTIVMPLCAVQSKRDAVCKFHGEIVQCADSAAERRQTAARIQAVTAAEFIHPYNDSRVIAGQGTCAVELCEQVPDLDAILVPVGGGGLLSGTCLAVSGRQRPVQVIGAEPEQADDACRSLEMGRLIADDAPDTIADGLRTPLLDLTWRVVHAHRPKLVRVGETAIVDAMNLFLQASGQLIEPSSAVAVAAAVGNPDQFSGKRIGVVITGGNSEISALPDWAQRKLRLT